MFVSVGQHNEKIAIKPTSKYNRDAKQRKDINREERTLFGPPTDDLDLVGAIYTVKKYYILYIYKTNLIVYSFFFDYNQIHKMNFYNQYHLMPY